MHDQERNDLQKLSYLHRWLTVQYWRWLLIKQRYRRQSLPMRLVPIHALIMLIITITFPYKHIPILTVPTLVVTAYYITIIIFFLTLHQPRKRKAFHWVKYD